MLTLCVGSKNTPFGDVRYVHYGVRGFGMIKSCAQIRTEYTFAIADYSDLYCELTMLDARSEANVKAPS